jgi:hypothetical protein
MIAKVGLELDVEISRRIFKRSRAWIWMARSLGVHPRYSRDWNAALKIIHHFYGLSSDPASDRIVAGYNAFFERFGPSPRGFVGLMIVGGCPCNVCDAALSAIRN